MTMYSKIQSQVEFSTMLTLAEAKAQCNILPSQTIDDVYITSLIPACIDLAQTYTNRLMSLGSVTLRADYGGSEILLPWGSPTVVTEILLDDVDVTAELDAYELDDITEKLTIVQPYSKLRVTYAAGYDTLPYKVKQGILLMINTMYEHRGDYVAGMTLTSIPLTSLKLLNSVKYYAT